ncbi:MAG: hypothetical protein K2P63_09625 [Lachnospiraceae bacterium]|nr:hypothetical protein [Lachnospiraceae bacterium]
MKNRSFKMMLSIVAAVIMLSNGAVVMAAPEVIQIGDEFTVFDPEYYQKHNADQMVKHMDREALIQYYITSGDYYDERTRAYAPHTDVTALLEPFRQLNEDSVKWAQIKLGRNVSTPMPGVESKVTTRSGEGVKGRSSRNTPSIYTPTPEALEEALKETTALTEASTAAKANCSYTEIQPGIREFMANLWEYKTSVTHRGHNGPVHYAIFYEIPTKMAFDNDIFDVRLAVSFYEGDSRGFFSGGSRDMTNYSAPGYEWRVMTLETHSEIELKHNIYNTINIAKYFSASADNSKDWQQISEPSFSDAYRFTIVQNNIEYPECKVFFEGRERMDGTAFNSTERTSVYMLVPSGYTGNTYCHVYGAVEENGQIVPDYSHRLTTRFPQNNN